MGGAFGPLALVSRQRLRLLLERPNVNAISGVAMLRGLAAIEESWIGAGGLQDRHFSAPFE
jgi:hypothetical protein